MNYKKCPKCDLNYIKNNEEICSTCLSDNKDIILVIKLNLNLDFQEFIHNRAFGKLEFKDLNFNLIYQRTRGVWRISDKRQKSIKLVLSVVKGIVIGVWKPDHWKKVVYNKTNKIRKEFDGKMAEKKIFDLYFCKNIYSLFRKGEQSPVRYFNEEQIKECPYSQFNRFLLFSLFARD